jgi:hypothetical protein
MGTLEQMSGLRREYRMNSWTRVIFTLLGLGIFGGGIFGAWKIMPLPGSGTLAAVFALVPTSMGLYMLAYAIRSRIIIDGSRITVRGAFQQKSADLGEIEGFRTVSSRNGTYTRLILKEGRGTITVSSSFNTDDDYRAWFQKITDLDERDRQALLDEISNQQDLGATPEERLAALSRAKAWSVGLLVLCALLGIVIDFPIGGLSEHVKQLSIVLLALAPVFSAYLVWRSPLLYAVFKKKKDPRNEVSFIPLVAGFAFMIHMSGVHFVAMQQLLLTMIAVCLALVALYFNAAKTGASGAIIGLLFFAGFYAYGVTTVADTAFDTSPAATYSTTVTGGHVSHGKSTSYYLRLAPWGPIQNEGDVSVSRRIYSNAHIGDTVCLALHNGSLHAPWFRVVPCEGDSAPQNTAPSGLPQ